MLAVLILTTLVMLKCGRRALTTVSDTLESTGNDGDGAVASIKETVKEDLEEQAAEEMKAAAEDASKPKRRLVVQIALFISSFGVKFKILISLYQVLTGLGVVFNIPYPDNYVEWLRRISAINIDLPTLLPMSPLDSLDPIATALMHRLAHLTTGRESKIVPSLFRHFAPWPVLLVQLADWMEDLNDGGVIDDQAARVFDMADDIAQDIFGSLLPPGGDAILPDPATRQTLVATIEMFPPTICRMIVIAGLLRSALSADIRSG